MSGRREPCASPLCDTLAQEGSDLCYRHHAQRAADPGAWDPYSLGNVKPCAANGYVFNRDYPREFRR